MVVLQRGSRSESDTTALREGRGEKRCRNPPFPSTQVSILDLMPQK